jgi:hypothetical protein
MKLFFIENISYALLTNENLSNENISYALHVFLTKHMEWPETLVYMIILAIMIE